MNRRRLLQLAAVAPVAPRDVAGPVACGTSYMGFSWRNRVFVAKVDTAGLTVTFSFADGDYVFVPNEEIPQ